MRSRHFSRPGVRRHARAPQARDHAVLYHAGHMRGHHLRPVFAGPVLAVWALFSPLLGQANADAPPVAAPRLDDKSFETLWQQVVPDANELLWLEIPWRAMLGDAVRQAHAADQPILLWAMNGHPLGCT